MPSATIISMRPLHKYSKIQPVFLIKFLSFFLVLASMFHHSSSLAFAIQSCDGAAYITDAVCRGRVDGDPCGSGGACVFFSRPGAGGTQEKGCTCSSTSSGGGAPAGTSTDPNITKGLRQVDLDSLNPLKTEKSPLADELSTPAGFLSRALLFAFAAAGLVLFVMILYGGFKILSGAQDDKSLQEGKQRITSALIGFLLLFSTYWVAQILQIVFGIRIVR